MAEEKKKEEEEENCHVLTTSRQTDKGHGKNGKKKKMINDKRRQGEKWEAKHKC